MPISVIHESERLTGLNLAMYQDYPHMSYNFLKKVDFPWPVTDIVLQHCECYDGAGFPRGLKGNDILIEARILAVAHALEDLTSHMAFRNAFPLKQALDEIKVHRESKYDPDVVDVCLSLFNEKGYKGEQNKR
jgi:HD-GYP domain-containing protein (c-di-GMP phosphodiesterase class II)